MPTAPRSNQQMKAVPEGLVTSETQEFKLRIEGVVLWLRVPFCWNLVVQEEEEGSAFFNGCKLIVNPNTQTRPEQNIKRKRSQHGMIVMRSRKEKGIGKDKQELPVGNFFDPW